MTDEAWPMIEEAVFRLFDELAAKYAGEHVAIGPQLAELGWSDIEAEYPIEACELLFRAQGRSLAHTDCLNQVMLAELAALLDEAADGIVLPDLGAGYAPGSDDDRVTGVGHTKVRVQFGAPIGSFQSPRHALADASAVLEGARALLGESWRYGGRLSAQTAKAAAGRAHRAVSDAALQVCGAVGLTAEHDLHRYVARGFQIDSLCGSYLQLESLLAERLFDIYAPGRGLPAIVAWG